MTELTLCIDSDELKSRLRAAAALMQADVHEMSLDQLIEKRRLPSHWVLVDQELDSIGKLVDHFKAMGKRPEGQIIRFIEKAWQDYVYHDIEIFASIVKPADPLAAVRILERLINAKPLSASRTTPGNDALGPYAKEFVRSAPMVAAVDQLQVLKHLPVDTVLLGPTGAGKDTAARWLHEQSGCKGNFIHINCAALPEQLFEAELFGVTAGAFTGAQKDRPGKMELANQGTLYLDEIDSLPLSCQAKLLNALQYRGAPRLGGHIFFQSNFRVIASTKVSLPDLVQAGKFREDLHFRLSVAQVNIPALANRLEDILPLYLHFLQQVADQFSMAVPSLDTEEVDELLSNPWRGNVRELHAHAQRHVLGLGAPCTNNCDVACSGGLKERLLVFEKVLVQQALESSKGCVKTASEQLGIPVHSLYYRLKRFELLEN